MRKTSSTVTSSSKRSTQFSPSRQRLLFALLTFSSLTSGGAALAAGGSLPTGGHFVGGAGAITSNGNNLTVSQSTQTGIINWQSFSIGKGDSVSIANGKGATLNRVTGGNISTIAGSLKSTGSVYVVNQAGIVVGPGGKVVTNGNFVASTRDVSNATFMAGGNIDLSGTSSGTVVNQGSITSTNGNVVLVGKSVTNSGSVSAAKGDASLVAGDNVLLQASGDDAVLVETGSGDVTNTGTVAAAQVALNAAGGNVYALAVNNGGVIRATGTKTEDGHVYLTAGDDLTVNSSVSATNADGSGGTIVATASTVSVGGKARISADGTGSAAGGTILIGGDRHGGTDPSVALSKTAVADAKIAMVSAGARISANGGAHGNGGNVVVWSQEGTDYAGAISAQGGAKAGDGGFVEVSGKQQLVFTGKVSTQAVHGNQGTLLLDPSDVTITTTTSNNTQDGGSPTDTFNPSTNTSTIAASDIMAALASNNVVITTASSGTANGDITISAPIDWSSDKSLSLIANGRISFGNSTDTITTTGAGNITLSAAGAGVSNLGGTALNVVANISAAGGTITLVAPTTVAIGNGIATGSTGFGVGVLGYQIIVSNGTTISNTQANGAGKIVLQADQVRLGSGPTPDATVTTPGEVDIAPTTPNATVYLGDTTADGSFFSLGNVALITGEDVRNVNANLLVIGSTAIGNTPVGSNPTPMLILTNPSAEGAPAFDAVGAQNLKLLTGPLGSVSQDANTPIIVDDISVPRAPDVLSPFYLGTGGLAVSTGGAITLNNPYNSVGTIAFLQTGVGAAGGNISFTRQGGDAAEGGTNLIVGTVGDISGITALGTTTTVTLTANETNNSAFSGATAGPLVVTQASGAANAITAGNLDLEGPASSFTLDNPANAVKNVAATVASLTLYDNVSLSTAMVGSSSGITATGDVTVVDNGLLTIGSSAGITTTGGNVRVEDQTFTNSDAGAAFNVTGGGNWRVYSQNPTQDHDDGANLSYSFVQYGATNSYATPFTTANAALNASAHGNGFLYTISPTAAETLTGTFNKPYDGTNAVIQSLTSGIYSAVTGTINGDTVTFNNPTGTNVTATYSSANAGTYTITLSPSIAIASATDAHGATIYGYGQTVTNNLSGTISPLALTITAGDLSKTYGQTATLGNSNFTVGAGLVGTQSVSSVTLTSTGAVATANVGGYDITPSAAVGANGFLASNYTITYNPGTLTVNPAALTITAGDQSKTYGQTASLGTTNYTVGAGQLQNGNTVTSVTLTSTGSVATANVGGYAIDGASATGGSGFLASNYTITYDPGTLTVNPAALTITAGDQSKTYGQTATLGTTDFTIGAGQLKNGNTITGVTLTSTGSVATANVGGYDIDGASATGAGGFLASNYTITYNPGTLTVNPAALTITAGDQSKTYGQTASLGTTDFTTGAGQLLNGNTVTGVTLTSTGSVATANVGGYAINGASATGGGGFLASNYTITYNPGTLTVNPAALTITAGNQSKTYGQTASLGTTDFTTGAGQLLNGNTVTGVTLTSTGSVATANVGGYAIDGASATGGGGFLASNYTITYNPGTLTVNPAALTITAGDQSKTYGQTASLGTTDFTTGAGQLKNGNTITGVTLTSTGSVASANVGSYDIDGASATGGGGFNAANYTITYDPGTLTVNPAALTINVGNQSKIYGQTGSLGTIDFTTGAGQLQNGNTITGVTLTSTGTVATANVGGYALDGASAAGGGGFSASNYTITYNPGTLTVNPAALTITAGNQTKTYGQTASLGTTDFTTGAGQLKNGNTVTGVTLTSPGSVSTANAGNYAITAAGAIGAGGFLASNYTITYDPGTLTVNPLGVTIAMLAGTRVYDGLLDANGSILTITDLVSPTDQVTLSGSGILASKNVGRETITSLGTLTLHGANAGNYTLVGATGYVDVTKATLTVSAVTQTRVYNGTTISTMTPTVAGLQTGDVTTGTLEQSYGSRNVLGTNGSTLAALQDIGVSDGNGGGNYTIVYKTAKGTITPEHVTVTATPNTKTYDGTDTATAKPILTAGVIYNPDTGTFTESYGTKNVGTGLTLTPTGSISDGNGGKNYIVTYVPISGSHPGPGGKAGIIDPALLTISAVSQTKVYDGNTTSTDTPVITAGQLFGGDTLTDLSQAFNSKDVLGKNGSTLSVNPHYILTDASDYKVTLKTAPGTITPLVITATGTRVYNGTTGVDGSILTITDLVPGDDIGITGTGTSSSPHVGTHDVTGGDLTLTGTDAKNYTLTGGTETVKITPFAVVLTGTRVYDGQTDGASGILSVTNAFKGDTVTVASGTSTIISRNVGNEKIVNFGTLTLGGSSAGDYTLVGAKGNVIVTPEMLTVMAVPTTKPQDGTTTSPGTPIVTSGTIFGPDKGGFIQTYGNIGPGNGITLTPSGSVNDGNGGNNYVVTFVSIDTGTITGPTSPTSPTTPPQDLIPNTQTASGEGASDDFFVPDSGLITLTPRQNGVVTGTIATIDGTDYQPDSQLGCTLGAAGCIQNGVAPTTTSAPPQ